MTVLERVELAVPPECLVACCDAGRLSAVAGDGFTIIRWVNLECVMGNQERERCDCLFFGQQSGESQTWWIGAIEFKASPTAKKATRQLQEGARYAAQFLGGHKNVEFRPVVVHGGTVRPTEYRLFKKETVTFLGKREPVRLKRKQAKFPMK